MFGARSETYVNLLVPDWTQILKVSADINKTCQHQVLQRSFQLFYDFIYTSEKVFIVGSQGFGRA
jgi:hypothetical protein